MNVVVIVESCFGNTAAVANEAVAALVEAGATVEVLAAQDAPNSVRADLILVGAPTHALGLPSAATRKKAAQLGATVPESGVGEWIARAENIDGRVVTFCTVTGRFTGSAANAAMRDLRRHGIRAERGPDFRVAAVQGPVQDDQPPWVREWATELAASYSSS